MKHLIIKTAIVSLIAGWLVYEYSSLPDVSILKKHNPRTTALMELRDQEYRVSRAKPVRRYIWASYNAISEHLKKAIIISEDASFYSHRGVDFFELKEAIQRDFEERGLKRGGSTITMQLARNLYLSPSKNPLRKLREIVIAWQLERALSKRRIFELYLNVAEWGPGIYGAEAASRHYFSKPASDLDPVEAATLAALLPSPRNPRPKSLLHRRNLILSRMAKIKYITSDERNRLLKTPLFSKGDERPGRSPRVDGFTGSPEAVPDSHFESHRELFPGGSVYGAEGL